MTPQITRILETYGRIARELGTDANHQDPNNLIKAAGLVWIATDRPKVAALLTIAVVLLGGARDDADTRNS